MQLNSNDLSMAAVIISALTTIGMGAAFVWREWRGDVRTAAQDVRADADDNSKVKVFAATVTAEIAEFGKKFDRAFEAIKEAQDELHGHVVECAELRGSLKAEQVAFREELGATRRMLEGLVARLQLRANLDHNRAHEIPASLPEDDAA
jgi:hypothetical protein